MTILQLEKKKKIGRKSIKELKQDQKDAPGIVIRIFKQGHMLKTSFIITMLFLFVNNNFQV